MIRLFPVRERYLGTAQQRAGLKALSRGLISTYVHKIKLNVPRSSDEQRVWVDPLCKKEVTMLKQLTWQFVIRNPALATKQHGERSIIRGLFEIFDKATRTRELTIFPFAFREQIEKAIEDSGHSTRVIADLVASMTEQQAVRMYHRLVGASLGSAMDYLAG